MLSARQHELMTRLLARKGGQTAVWRDEQPRIQPDQAGRFAPFPLTDVQYGYWMGRAAAFELGSVASYGYQEYEVDDLDPERYRIAWHKVIARHDMLRAVIEESGMQRVLEQVPPLRIAEEDLSSLDDAAREQRLLAIRRDLSHRVSDTGRWPLFEIQLSRLSARCWRIHWGSDALLADVYSDFIIQRELLAFYRQPDLELPPLTLCFRDYVLALVQEQRQPVGQHARDYWSNRLDSLPTAPALPLSPTVVTETPRFTRRRFTLALSRWSRLKQLAVANGLTPSMALCSVFAYVLRRWCERPAFTLNLTLFNRQPWHPDVDRIVGDFTSTLLLQVDEPEEDETFTQATRRLQNQFWQDLEHRGYSGLRVVQDLARRHKRGGQALMPVVFTSVLAIGDIAQRLESDVDLLGTPGYAITQTPQVLLDHQVHEEYGALIVTWDAIDSAFPVGLLDDMLKAQETCLVRLAETEAQWECPLTVTLPPEQVLRQWQANQTDGEPAQSDALLHQLFHRQARRQPQAPAVFAERRTLTYGELQRRVIALGDLLRNNGVRPGDVVAVLGEKGWPAVVAVLGVLEAGAAYLPLAADLPPLRLRQLLDDSGARLVLTTAESAHRTEPDGRSWMATAEVEPAPQGADPRETQTDVQAMAYLIYTSGSTGAPKGVMVSHAAAVNTLLDLNRRFAIGADDRVLALSALNFDLSVYDIFGTLAAGGGIVMPDTGRERDAEHWLARMIRDGVTVWNSVPALLQMLLSVGGDALAQAAPRLVWLSGDWIPPHVPTQVRSCWPASRLVSMGGATEAAIWSISWEVPETGVPAGWSSVPYGTALGNQQVWVLDDHLEPCPEWVSGEIYLGGRGLAQGYWRDEERSTRHFITHPRSGERLYRTGDRGRWRPEGWIEFQGRDDGQVKIRGHRIELGEIEQTLRQCPGVTEAVVTALGGERQLNGMGAWLVIDDDMPFISVVRAESAVDDDGWRRLSAAGEDMPDDDGDALDDFLPHWRQLQTLYVQAAGLALNQLGLFRLDGSSQTLDDLIRLSGIAPRYEKWLRRALACLTEEGYLEENQGGWRRAKPLPVVLSDDILRQVEQRWTEQGYHTRTLALIRENSQNLARVLTETVHSAEIYTNEAVTELYQRQFAVCNRRIEAIIAQWLNLHAPEKTLRIIEVGAGIGSTTAHILPLLAGRKVQYCFTDISTWFFERAKARFADYPWLEYRLMDLETQPALQDAELQPFDLVVAASVLHVPQRVAACLRHVNQLLAPGGLLLAIEETRFFPWFDMGMGLQSGFERFCDEELRPDHPLLTREQWCDALTAAGFADVAVLNYPATVNDYLGFDILLARNTAQQRNIDGTALCNWLAQRLPDYMIPSRYLCLEALPLNANGKVERRALPAFDDKAPLDNDAYQAPQGERETYLAAQWRELLGRAEVSARDDFFRSGGDSLLAARLQQMIQHHQGWRLPLRHIFQHPVLCDMAARIETEDEPALLTLGEGSQADTIVWLPGADGDPASLTGLARALAWPGEQLAVNGWCGESVEHQAKGIASALLRTRRLGAPGVWLIGFSGGGVTAWELAQQLLCEDYPLRGVILIDTVWTDDEAQVSDALLLTAFARSLGADVAYVDADAERSAIWSDLAASTGLPQEGDDGLLARYDAFRRATAVLMAYQPSGLALPVCYLRAVSNVNGADFWRQYALGDWSEVALTSAHFDCLRSPHVFDTAAQLAAWLAMRNAGAPDDEA